MRLEKIYKNPFLWAFLIGIGSLHLIKEMALRRRHAPQALVQVDDWQLTDHNGKVLGKKDLAGRVVIANYFFTSCPSLCPKLTEAMKEVYVRLSQQPDKFAFISISVDPTTDTPELLREYMVKNGLSYENWHCLTGTQQEVHHVVVDTMRVHMGEREYLKNSPETYDIPHLAHLALFDQKGDLRGLFKTESIELAALVRAANFLVEKPD